MFFKRATALFILLAVIVQVFNRCIIIADYYINTSTYIQNCVNKKVACMHCNGKCQLNKKLKQQENSDKQNQERKADNKSSPLSSKSWFANSLFRYINSAQISYPEFICGKTEIRPRLFFHPPDFLTA